MNLDSLVALLAAAQDGQRWTGPNPFSQALRATVVVMVLLFVGTAISTFNDVRKGR